MGRYEVSYMGVFGESTRYFDTIEGVEEFTKNMKLPFSTKENKQPAESTVFEVIAMINSNRPIRVEDTQLAEITEGMPGEVILSFDFAQISRPVKTFEIIEDMWHIRF